MSYPWIRNWKQVLKNLIHVPFGILFLNCFTFKIQDAPAGGLRLASPAEMSRAASGASFATSWASLADLHAPCRWARDGTLASIRSVWPGGTAATQESSYLMIRVQSGCPVDPSRAQWPPSDHISREADGAGCRGSGVVESSQGAASRDLAWMLAACPGKACLERAHRVRAMGGCGNVHGDPTRMSS